MRKSAADQADRALFDRARPQHKPHFAQQTQYISNGHDTVAANLAHGKKELNPPQDDPSGEQTWAKQQPPDAAESYIHLSSAHVSKVHGRVAAKTK